MAMVWPRWWQWPRPERGRFKKCLVAKYTWLTEYMGCVYACTCVCKREKERERENVRECLHIWTLMKDKKVRKCQEWFQISGMILDERFGLWYNFWSFGILVYTSSLKPREYRNLVGKNRKSEKKRGSQSWGHLPINLSKRKAWSYAKKGESQTEGNF